MRKSVQSVMKTLYKNVRKFESVHMGFYISGLENEVLPKFFRKLIAKTKLHRAWLSGKNMRFSEMSGGIPVQHGICGYFNQHGLIESMNVRHLD